MAKDIIESKLINGLDELAESLSPENPIYEIKFKGGIELAYFSPASFGDCLGLSKEDIIKKDTISFIHYHGNLKITKPLNSPCEIFKELIALKNNLEKNHDYPYYIKSEKESFKTSIKTINPWKKYQFNSIHTSQPQEPFLWTNAELENKFLGEIKSEPYKSEIIDIKSGRPNTIEIRLFVDNS